MQKLINGIREFRRNVQPAYRAKFAHLALSQAPDTLFIACSDSRVVPNLFASTDPGDLFVVRNVGNLVPPCGVGGRTSLDRSAPAAIEFAVMSLGVRDIVVCGHSDCGAMRALLEGAPPGAKNLGDWLGNGHASRDRMGNTLVGEGLLPHNQLSQVNVLQQLDHLRTYPAVSDRLAAGELRLHAWWFDLGQAEVLAFDEGRGAFEPIAGE